MIDVTISIWPIPGLPLENSKWAVEVSSTQPWVREAVAPLTDEDLRDLSDLPASCRTWRAFLNSLSPGGSYSPGLAVLRSVGARLYERLLGKATFATHLQSVEEQALREDKRIRFLIDLEEGDATLASLPIELIYHSDEFLLKRPARPAFRLASKREASNLSLQPGSRVLIATAHSDTAAEPSRDALAEHAAALAVAAAEAGFTSEHLPDASGAALCERLSSGAPVDLLYLACHGMEDRDLMGSLALRGKPLFGVELAKILEKTAERRQPVKIVALCACSSAATSSEDGTLGMAQWLAAPRRAVASIGFRGPVLVPWALKFTEALFKELGRGASIEAAFSEARWLQPDQEPQWPLPVLYCPRPDLADPRRHSVTLGETTRSASFFPLDTPAAPLLPSRLPRPTKPYFTGRGADLEALVAWAETPGAAVIAAVQGQGGIGKTELALAFAHKVRQRGRSVVWLERPDRDLDGAVAALIAVAQPSFEAPAEATLEDLVALMRRELVPFDGLLVLDDVSDSRAVELLQPGSGWNVLVTTRTRNLVPGVADRPLGPLEPADALRLLSQVAWGSDLPPAEETADAKELVGRLSFLPLALELAGSTLRNLVSAREYLESLGAGTGVAAGDQERLVAVMGRSLRDLAAEDLEVFFALGVLPAVGSDARTVATTLGQPLPVTTRRLDRLVRHSLAGWAPETCRYRLHPELRREAERRLGADSEAWQRLHAGAAAAIKAKADWVREPLGTHVQLAWDRWRAEADWFDAIDPKPWLDQKAPNAGDVGSGIVSTISFRPMISTSGREASLSLADQLLPSSDHHGRGSLYWRQGELKRFSDDLEGAARDYDRALELFTLVGDQRGQANLLKARGDLKRHSDQHEGASTDYERALELFTAVKDQHGQALVLKARGELKHFRSDLEGASTDYGRALELFTAIEYRGGRASVLKARGELRQFRSDLNGASDDFDLALELFTISEDRLGQAQVLQARGDLRQFRSDIKGAARDFDQALELFTAVEYRLGQANVLRARGDLNRSRADFDGAANDYERALEIFTTVQYRLGQAYVLQSRGHVKQFRSDLEGASDDYDRAFALFTTCQDRLGIANVLQLQGDLEKKRQDLIAARRYYEESVPHYRAIADNVNLSNVLSELCPVYLALGEDQKAQEALTVGLPLAEKSNNHYARDKFKRIRSQLEQYSAKDQPSLEQTPTAPPPE